MNAPAPTIRLGKKSRCSFHVWGVAGYFSAFTLAIGLAAHAHLKVHAVLLMLVLAITVFLSLAMATKIVLRTECLIYYHHEIAVLAASAALVRLLHLPVLAYLDIAVVGLGTFLAFGRLGCAAVGCCYGKPAGRGFVYGAMHAEAGFPARLCGVRLFPVQWIESAFVAVLTAIAAGLVWRGAPTGAAFIAYTAGYSLIRFGLEFLRGDDDRSYTRGFSTAQWTSAVIWVFLFAARPALALALPLMMCALGIYRRRRGAWLAWFEAGHIHELAALMATARCERRPLVLKTSRGLMLSAGSAKIGDALVEHYTLSSPSFAIPRDRAIRLAHLMARLRGRDCFRGSLVDSPRGIVHLVLSDRPS